MYKKEEIINSINAVCQTVQDFLLSLEYPDTTPEICLTSRIDNGFSYDFMFKVSKATPILMVKKTRSCFSCSDSSLIIAFYGNKIIRPTNDLVSEIVAAASIAEIWSDFLKPKIVSHINFYSLSEVEQIEKFKRELEKLERFTKYESEE